MSNIKVIHGDSLIELDKMEENSVGSICCDPPYEIGFMGREWDKTGIAVNPEIWEKCLKAVKPGGYLLAFAGTRTMHRIAVAIEYAGWEIRDTICWHYANGMPHGNNIGKAIDKKLGTERKVIGKKYRMKDYKTGMFDCGKDRIDLPITKGNSIGEGMNTNLKPATELIIMARKPIEKGLTIAENFMKWGVGGINIDDCRIEHNEDLTTNPKPGKLDTQGMGWGFKRMPRDNSARYPANVIFDEEMGKILDQQQEGASRFFYVPKENKRNKNAGCESVNNHPTVKSIKLLEYLITMITPEGQTVLDPFMGSGSTGISALNLGFDYIGIEKEKEYFEIAEKRIAYWKEEKSKQDDLNYDIFSENK